MVERRAEAKENASQHNTHRALNWERVTQALERVRQAARCFIVIDPRLRAVCEKAARTVLCGGRSAMTVPTAIFNSAD